MKKIAFLLLSLCFISCASTTLKTVSETFEQQEILGTVDTSTISFSWVELKRGNNTTETLISKLEKKAIKKYGKNIKLVNVTIGSPRKVQNTIQWVVLPITFLAVAGSKVPDDYSGQQLPPLFYGASAASYSMWLFKTFGATATVISSDTPYQRGSLSVYTENEIRLIREEERQKQKKIAEEKKAEETLQTQKNITELEQKLINRAKECNSPLAITRSGIYDINTADGVSVMINFINTSNKKIKYIYFDLLPYNRVDDAIVKFAKTVTLTNYIEPSDNVYTFIGDCIWYDSTLSYFDILSIKVIFNDNTEKVINDNLTINKICFSKEEQLIYDYLIH